MLVLCRLLIFAHRGDVIKAAQRGPKERVTMVMIGELDKEERVEIVLAEIERCLPSVQKYHHRRRHIRQYQLHCAVWMGVHLTVIVLSSVKIC